jgi:hypothetical protein
VADALSRKEIEKEELSLSLLSIPIVSWVEELKNQYQVDKELKQLMSKWHLNELDGQKYSLRDNLLFYKHKLLLGQSP